MASARPGSGSASFSHGMDESLQTLPISCRFIPFDQWLVTHVNPKWKVRTIKYWFLKKCGAPQDFELPQPHRRPPSPIVFAQGPQKKKRAISPIQFAPTRPASHINSDDEAVGYEEDDEESDADKPTIVHPQPNVNSEPEPPAIKRRVKTKSKVIHPHEISPYDPERLTLLRYSTGQVLEDDYTLDWYEIQPNELLELHRSGVFIRLPRTVLMPYVQPYWEGWVKALRVVGTPHRKNSDPEVQKLEWRPRWVVVRDGELSLCKDRSESPPSKSLSLSHLTDLRGAEHLVNSTAITPDSNQRIICAKFKIRSTTTRVSYEAADQTAPSVTVITAQSKHLQPSPIRTSASRKRASTISHTPVHRDGNGSDSTDPDGEDSDTTLSSPVFAHEDMSDDELLGAQNHTLLGLRTTGYGYKYRGTKPIPPSTPSTPPNSLSVSTTSMHAQRSPQNYEIGEWIVLDLPEDNAYTSLLRTLHRQFPHDTQTVAESSTFVSGLLPTLESPPQTPSWSPKYQQSQSSTHPRISTPSQSRKPGLPKSNALGAMPFPEWRTELVRRARRAGLGHIGGAMGCVLHALDPLSASDESMHIHDDDDDDSKIEVSTVREDSEIVAFQVDDDDGDNDHDDGCDDDDDGDGVDFGDIDSDGDSDSSQVEWEGWMADLHRQARIVRAAPSIATTASDEIPADLNRLHLEPSATVRSPSWTSAISPSVHTHTTLSSPSSNESLYNRHSRRVDSTRRPSMPSISIFANAHSRQDGSSSTANSHSRQSSSLSQRPSMPSLGRAASVSVLKKEKGKQKEEDSAFVRKDKDKKKKHRLSNPLPLEEPQEGSSSKKKTGFSGRMEKIISGLDPTLDFVDAR